MDSKVRILVRKLSDVFADGHVEYRFEAQLHKFRIDHEGPTFWLYISREFAEDHTEEELVTSLVSWNISEAFRSSPKSRWLFLSETGVREVDCEFGKDR
ncbi:hypothetical protein SUTH_03258 [Sulfuritalea hydrogenivorans sk43H]|uniref:Uncharacterized protein n=1 Tax=Sulfuritalea hydrogenivorans sk43H TaxID=1223802 RepID=W0SJT9_9PROT|nr:hypothetical protein SUTH_03258 [Sulfuritalea hydrogenivorans sk43H]